MELYNAIVTEDNESLAQALRDIIRLRESDVSSFNRVRAVTDTGIWVKLSWAGF